MSTDQQSSDILSNKSESMSILNSDSNISEQSNVILNPSVENKMDKSKPFHKLKGYRSPQDLYLLIFL
jgi:hypothetical protein